MTVPTAIQRHLKTLGMESVLVTDKRRSGADCIIRFRNNAVTEYVQITSYDSRLLLSWGVLGFPRIS